MINFRRRIRKTERQGMKLRARDEEAVGLVECFKK